MTGRRRHPARALPLLFGLPLFLMLQAAPASAVTCAGVQVWAPTPGQGWRLVAPAEPGTRQALSATATEDALFSIRLDGPVEEGLLLHLSFYLPGGHRYQSLAVPVVPESAPPGRRRLPGYPLPVDEHPVQLRGDRQAPDGLGRFVDVAFPVGGTAIVASSLYGEWTVEVRAADESEACATVDFKISE